MIHNKQLNEAHFEVFNKYCHMPLIDGSYSNDATDSLFNEEFQYQIYLPNSTVDNSEQELFNTFAINVNGDNYILEGTTDIMKVIRYTNKWYFEKRLAKFKAKFQTFTEYIVDNELYLSGNPFNASLDDVNADLQNWHPEFTHNETEGIRDWYGFTIRNDEQLSDVLFQLAQDGHRYKFFDYMKENNMLLVQFEYYTKEAADEAHEVLIRDFKQFAIFHHDTDTFKI